MRAAGIAIILLASLPRHAFGEPRRLTFGADVGAAAMREANRSAGTSSGVYYGFAFGAEIGTTVTPTLDITLRVLAVRGGDAQQQGDFFHVTSTFIGPRAEYRPLPRLQVGIGFGLGMFDDPRRAGYAADLQVGYSIWRAERDEFDIGIESAPTFVPETPDRYSRDLLNVALVVGYRHR